MPLNPFTLLAAQLFPRPSNCWGGTAASAMPGCLKSALVETPSQAEAVLGQSQSAMRRVDINTEHLSSALSSIPAESVYASLRWRVPVVSPAAEMSNKCASGNANTTTGVVCVLQCRRAGLALLAPKHPSTSQWVFSTKKEGEIMATTRLPHPFAHLGHNHAAGSDWPGPVRPVAINAGTP